MPRGCRPWRDRGFARRERPLTATRPLGASRLAPSALRASTPRPPRVSPCPHDCSDVTPLPKQPIAPTGALFSMLLHYSTLAQSISVEFHRGGTKPEVLFRSGSRCCRRVFHVALDHPRLAQSSETSSTAPEYYFRFAAATPDFRPNRLAEPP